MSFTCVVHIYFLFILLNCGINLIVLFAERWCQSVEKLYGEWVDGFDNTRSRRGSTCLDPGSASRPLNICWLTCNSLDIPLGQI